MKVKIVEIGTTTLKDGSTFDFVKALVNVQKYGKSSLELITVKVPAATAYKAGEFDLDIALPYSEYAYTLQQ